MIIISGLSKKYKNSEEYAVKNLNLTIGEGEIYGLLGPNGAGKTTLISMLTSLVKPTTGSFSINGLTFAENKTQLQQLLGIVPQEYALYPSLTAFENLEYFGSMYGLTGHDLKYSIREHLEIMGLSKFAHKRTSTYSGGMKRRVNLIAGILHKPKVLFLDEPTVGVDVQSKNVIMAHLKLLNQQGTTIVYTSHHLNEAQTFCTQIAIIDNGEIVITGNPMQLIKNAPQAHNLEELFLAITGNALRDYA